MAESSDQAALPHFSADPAYVERNTDKVGKDTRLSPWAAPSGTVDQYLSGFGFLGCLLPCEHLWYI